MTKGTRIIQILPATNIEAVYVDDDGTEIREAVRLIALRSDGTISYLTVEPDGIAGDVTEVANFLRLEFDDEREAVIAALASPLAH